MRYRTSLKSRSCPRFNLSLSDTYLRFSFSPLVSFLQHMHLFVSLRLALKTSGLKNLQTISFLAPSFPASGRESIIIRTHHRIPPYNCTSIHITHRGITMSVSRASLCAWVHVFGKGYLIKGPRIHMNKAPMRTPSVEFWVISQFQGLLLHCFSASRLQHT